MKSVDIAYEVEMLRNTALMILSRGYPDFILYQNAFLESFLTHAKNLGEFLYYYKGKDKEDVRARDFVADYKNYYKELRGKEQLFELTTKINKHMAHLTFTRIERSENIHWDIVEIRNLIESALAVFYANLQEGLRPEFYYIPQRKNIEAEITQSILRFQPRT